MWGNARVEFIRSINSKVARNNKRARLTQEILEHWEDTGKSEGDTYRRLGRLSEAVRAVRSPHEVWENPVNGQRTYQRVYKDDQGKFATSGFVTAKSGEVRSFFHDRQVRSMERMRKGKLIYKRK